MSHPWKFGDVLERGKYDAPYHRTMRVMVIATIEVEFESPHARVIFLRHDGGAYEPTRTGEISTVSGWVKVEE